MDKAQRGPGGLSEAERDLLLAELWDTFTLKLDHAALATQSLRETAYLFMRAIQGGHVTYKSRDVADPDAPSSMKTVAIQLGKMSGAGYIAPVEGSTGWVSRRSRTSSRAVGKEFSTWRSVSRGSDRSVSSDHRAVGGPLHHPHPV
ncbi:MAG: hypothetical protein M5R38_07355 [Candidatus Methylomirabilis sp.]|nr:hypothetical protein [Candidatus Methylomirabilis sp.]